MLDFSKFIEVNVVSTALLYETLVERHLKPQKVIVASSQAVYGEGQYSCPEHGIVMPNSRSPEQLKTSDWDVRCPECGVPVESRLLEEKLTNPFNQYAVSKLSGEKLALGLGRLHGIPSVGLRYSITQGPRQSLFNQYSGILRIFSARAMAGQPILVYEDGRQTRDFVHVQDVVDANFAVLKSPAADYEAFNVGSGQRLTILQYAESLISHVGKRVELLVPGEYRVGDNRHTVSSIAKLKKLGWAPQRALSKIHDDFLAWVQDLGGIPASIPDAYAAMRSSGVVRSVA
jgi:dTDP-L-rhamnose 4-epimerase